MLQWQVEHLNIIKMFIWFLNQNSDRFILKGGTSLMLCYGLDRFSEDVDLDGFDKRLFIMMDRFVKYMNCNGYSNIQYRKAKDTDTVKRAIVHYGTDKTLKIEVYYRTKLLCDGSYCKINGINVYNIDILMSMKILAFTSRDKIRDLYDITFIYLHYKNNLSMGNIINLQTAVSFKGLEYFDYLIKQQSDELIDGNKLAENFLKMYYDLGFC
jgi:predicted nucleotidyltransferase component of viral defense system